jgi:high-affinity iron transporter
VALAVLGVAYLAITASGGPTDPTDPGVAREMSRTSIVFNAAIIVFREGLEAVLIFAAVTASFVGANRVHKKPVVVGALCALLSAALTYVLAQAVLQRLFAVYGARVQAVTGVIAVGVLLVVLNWFLHKVYWTGWISRHHRKRRELLSAAGKGALGGQALGFVALGFTTVFREGVEVVLFLQALELQAGTLVVLEGVGIGLAGVAVVGLLTFKLQRRLPYKKMLIVTGMMISLVLVVMVGGSALSFQDVGWLPSTPLHLGIPGWMGAWFELYDNLETLLAQALAAVLVFGSYFAAGACARSVSRLS